MDIETAKDLWERNKSLQLWLTKLTNRSYYLSPAELERRRITELPPLSWDGTLDNDPHPMFTAPLPEEELYSQLDPCRVPVAFPYPQADGPSDPAALQLRRSGWTCDQIYMQLRTWASSNQPLSCGWSSPMRSHSNSGLWTGCSGSFFLTPSSVHLRSWKFHGLLLSADTIKESQALCVIGNASPALDAALLRSEVVAATMISQGLLQQHIGRAFKGSIPYSIYPVTIVSISGLCVRIVQVHIDPSNGTLMYRKTPYLMLNSDLRAAMTDLGPILRWICSTPCGDVTSPVISDPLEATMQDADGDATLDINLSSMEVDRRAGLEDSEMTDVDDEPVEDDAKSIKEVEMTTGNKKTVRWRDPLTEVIMI